MQFGSAGGSIYLDDQSVLVKPDVAEKQLQAETTVSLQTNVAATNVETGTETVINSKGETFKAPTTSPLEPLATKLPTRFHGTIALDATRLARDAGQVAEEVIQHLASIVGSNVEITLEIQASVPNGVPDNTVRIVTENCRTLKFKSFGFEED